MELPAIKIPQIELPFDIPLLMHPPVDHFIIALPIIILFIEFINLFVKKRAIGVVSFLLIVLTVVASVAAYLTGSIDGKEAYPLLNEAAQGELKEHKLLGTWLMVASAVVLVFKLLSAMIQRGLMKGLYLLILIIFVAGILKQGKEGGELVYKYGANVELVKSLDDEMFDLKEELDELKEEAAKTPVDKAVEAVKETAAEVKETVESKTAEVVEAVEKKAEEVQEKAADTVEPATEKVEEKAEEAKEAVEETAAKVEASTEEKKSENA